MPGLVMSLDTCRDDPYIVLVGVVDTFVPQDLGYLVIVLIYTKGSKANSVTESSQTVGDD